MIWILSNLICHLNFYLYWISHFYYLYWISYSYIHIYINGFYNICTVAPNIDINNHYLAVSKFPSQIPYLWSVHTYHFSTKDRSMCCSYWLRGYTQTRNLALGHAYWPHTGRFPDAPTHVQWVCQDAESNGNSDFGAYVTKYELIHMFIDIYIHFIIIIYRK